MRAYFVLYFLFKSFSINLIPVDSFIFIFLMATSVENKIFKRGTKKILCSVIKYFDQEAEN